MKLSNREVEKNQLVSAGFIAQRRLAQGIRLNVPETIALIASQIVLFARQGYSVAELMNQGRHLLGHRQVRPGVAHIVDEMQVEATFPDGTKLVTIHDPIHSANGNLAFALQGSFLPVPSLETFRDLPNEDLIPGEMIVLNKPIFLNADRECIQLEVMNTADRPIQVGSHYHFIETNRYLRFDRELSYGKRLNIAAGTSVRFEPGETKIVSLVQIAGNRIIRGGNGLCDGPYHPSSIAQVMSRVSAKNFLHQPSTLPSNTTSDPTSKRQRIESSTSAAAAPASYQGLEVRRDLYCRMFGPTTGDILRLADTDLFIRVEHDFTVPGDECKFGGGKTLREGMGQATGIPAAQQLDTVITNALIIDYTGIYKADIGIKDGYIIGIGKAGNPDVMAGINPACMIVGVNTEAIAGEGLIITAGGFDSHVHFICPQILIEAIGSGLTTMLGGGTGPASGTCATTCTPSPNHIKMMLQATDNMPLNIGLTGKGNSSAPEGMIDAIAAGCVGLKLHEDWGTTPAAINACLTLADAEDIQVTIHTDTLNESSCVEHTLEAINNRTIHTYHTEGAGGGHAPDIITVVSHPNVIPSSTNPTRPLTKNTIDEHLDMLMVCHHLDKDISEDVSFAESRIRQETVAAEDILHDLGAISIISSDSQAMGRVGEVITRTWQTADKMKKQRGQLPEDVHADSNHKDATYLGGRSISIMTDNFRVKRYIAKYTINPAVAHGVSDVIGSVEVGKLADLVFWKPAYFGVKPEMIVKGGYIAYAMMGDANASIPTPEPVSMRPMFAGGGGVGHSKVAANSSFAFVSRRCFDDKALLQSYGLSKMVYPIRNTRNIGKKDMRLNDAMPQVTVDPETYVVTIDGKIMTCAPVDILPMAQLYFMH